MKDGYFDMINLPRHVSNKHPHMAVSDRAAQFSPFAALTGYEAAIKETARLTDRRIELDEYSAQALSDRLQILAEKIAQRPEIAISYFQPDAVKSGGAYLVAIGAVKKIDEYQRLIILADKTVIPIDDIIALDGAIFKALGDQ